MDSAALFVFVVMIWCLHRFPTATRREQPAEGTHSAFSAAYTSPGSYTSLPHLPHSLQGNHFLFRKAHEDPCVWSHVTCVSLNIHTAVPALFDLGFISKQKLMIHM